MSSPSEKIREQFQQMSLLTTKAPSVKLDSLNSQKPKFSDIFLSKAEIDRVDSSSSYVGEIVEAIVGSRKQQRKKSQPTLRKLGTQLSQYFKKACANVSVVENASMSKMLALVCLADNKELEACCHLIASHSSCLRQQILYRNLKSQLRKSMLSEPMINNLNPKDLDIDLKNINTNPDKIVSTLRELPTEWYVLQMTLQHENLVDLRHRIPKRDSAYPLNPMHGLHLLALPTGKNAANPICITVPKPNANTSYDVCVEVETLLNRNRADLTANYNNSNELYWKARRAQNEKMSTAIFELEFSWLREWRILLLADYIECLDLVQDIHNMIDKLIADSNIKAISERTRWLLKKVATGACYLQPFEIERAVTYVLFNEKKLAKNIILSIVAKTKVMKPLKQAKRKTLILIVDESLDHLSFESLTLLEYQPVTRFPSLHIAYALYNQHKSTMQNGFKLIKKSENFGTFIVNPSLDLEKMEKRIKSFMEYWLPKWEGLYGQVPDQEHFKKALTQYELLMYNGHGSGIQFLRGEEVERIRVLASVLLFGCSSIKLSPVGGRQPAYGISNQYFMGCSPCILGMLWEVTDGDIDRMTADFLSTWISSSAKRPWCDVNPSSWNRGKIEFEKTASKEIKTEDDMLVAVAKSKEVCKQYMTSAAIIVRGLPVKLVD